jgi:hypothetical protein
MMGRLRVVAAHVVVVAEGHPALAAGEAIAEHPRGTLACLLPEVEALTIAEQQHRTAEAVCALDRKRVELSGRHVEHLATHPAPTVAPTRENAQRQ